MCQYPPCGKSTNVSTYPFFQLVQDVDLDERLLMESFLVPYDFDGAQAPKLVINASHYLSKAALSEYVDDLIPIRQVIAHDNVVVASLIIVSEIGRAGSRDVANVLLRRFGATEIDSLLVVNNLPFLVDVEQSSGELYCLCRTHALLRCCLFPQSVCLSGGSIDLLSFRG